MTVSFVDRNSKNRYLNSLRVKGTENVESHALVVIDMCRYFFLLITGF